jgi:molybdate transport system ATP-binding protein
MPRIELECEHQYAAGFRLQARFRCDSLITAFFGPSGSGKTTTLMMIAGLLRPQRGRICVGDQVFSDTATARFLPPEQRQIGFLFQELHLFPHLSVQANLRYGGRSSPPRVWRRTIDALELGDLLTRYPRSLSGGQQQRVALGRALLSAPRLLLLDEPVTAIESSLRAQVMEFTRAIIQEFEIPTILVTHSRPLVDQLATQVIVFDDGRTSEESISRGAATS